MNRNEFWSIIGNASHLKTNEKYEKLYHDLSKCSVKSICHFGYFLMLYVSCAESPASWLLCKLITGGVSDDSELYFRLWLSSLGKTVFLGSLKNLDFILESNLQQGAYGFEELMHLAGAVLREKKLDVDAVWKKHSLPDAEIAQVRAEVVVADVHWAENPEEFLSQAKIIAPKLYAHYKNTTENLTEKQKETVKKIADMYRESAQKGSLESVAKEVVNVVEDASINEIMKEINETGVDFLPYAYTGSSPVRVIGSNRKIGFINKKGKLIIPPQYEEAEEFQLPVTIARKNGKWGIINKKGIEVVPIRYDKMRSHYFEEGLLPVSRDCLWGAVNEEGVEVVPCQYEGVSICSERFLSVVKNGKSAILGKDGVLHTDFIFDHVSPFYNGRAIFSRDGKSGIIDEKCCEILPPIYDQIEDFNEYANLAAAFIYGETQENKMGFIDRNGQVIVPITYNNIYRIHGKPEKTILYLGDKKIPIDLSIYIEK